MRSRGPLTRGRQVRVLAWLTLAVAGAAVLGLLVGPASLNLGRALGDATSLDHTILLDLRLPRVLQGLLVGGVLAGAGAALQGLLRNPLADPFLLGVSGGAALGAAAAALTGLGAVVAEPTGGFLGALGALALVSGLGRREGRMQPLDVLLVGVVFNAFAGALLMVLQAVSDAAAVQRVLLRLMGTLAADPSRPLLLPALLVATLLGAVAVLPAARRLDLLGLGDEAARGLGVDPDRTRWTLFVALSIPIGAVVAVAGMIGFVGLLVPHAVRLVLGPDHRLLLPASALSGAGFLVLADAAVRALAGPLGTELPVGVLTATLGGPVFVWLLRRGRVRVGP